MAWAGQAAFPFLIECVLINGAEIGALVPVRGQQVDIVTPDDRIIGCRPPTDPGPLGDRTERRGRFGPRRRGQAILALDLCPGPFLDPRPREARTGTATVRGRGCPD